MALRNWTDGVWAEGLWATGVWEPAFVGATYYVAKNGNDSNDGSLASPWLTARKGSRSLVPGDTLYFRADGGVSTEYVETAGPAIDWSTAPTGGFGTSWAAEQKITIAAYPGDEGLIVLKRDTASGTAVADMRATSAAAAARYVEFKNLIFDGWKNSTGAREYVPCYVNGSPRSDNAVHDIRFVGCEMRYSSQSSGILVEASVANALGIPYEIQIKGDSATGRRALIHDNGTTTLQHGIYLQGRNCLVEDADVYDNAGLGIQIHRDTPLADNCKDITIRRCRVWGNTQTGIYYGKGSGGRIWNCLVYDNGSHGVRFDDGASSGEAGNCTSVRNTTANFTIANTAAVTAITFVNCIARKLGVTTNNLSEAAGGAQLTITTSINIATADTDATDPGFVNPAGDDFSLAEGSVAIGAGTDKSASYTTDVEGVTWDTWDIGAYHYVAAAGGNKLMLMGIG